MHYVYLLESLNHPDQRYIGCTRDLRARLARHNSGASRHTRKYFPWRLVTYVAFSTEAQAVAFERYLKSSSGHAFAKKRLWWVAALKPPQAELPLSLRQERNNTALARRKSRSERRFDV